MAYVYATLAEIKRRVDRRLLVQLTNDDDTVDPTAYGSTDSDPGSINEAVLADAENEAANTINNHLRNVYSLPLAGDTLTPEIVMTAAKLTLCNLWERRGNEPEAIRDLRQRLLARLKAMGKPVADEVRGARTTAAGPVRSATGKPRTIFSGAGYFDGLGIDGRRDLAGDTENANL